MDPTWWPSLESSWSIDYIIQTGQVLRPRRRYTGRWCEGQAVQHLQKVKCHLKQEKGIPAGRVKAQHLYGGISDSKQALTFANLCTAPLQIPSSSALIEWILYGIHTHAVRIVSNPNQKIKLLHYCSHKLPLFATLTVISLCNIFHYICSN